MRTAKRAALAAIATTIMAMTSPLAAAHADQGDTLRGGCAFDAIQQAGFSNHPNRGVIMDLSVSQEASGGPSGATVSCFIMINGVEAAGTRVTASGIGVQAAQKEITYTAGEFDGVALCQQVTFDDGSTWTGPDGANPDCPASAGPQFPPQFIVDTLNTVVAAVCPVLRSLGPQDIGGVVSIDSDGDVTVNDPLGLVGTVYVCSLTFE